jgi:type II secretory pathway pseudopilin PulG
MKKGLTLIEAMIALGISAAVTTGGLSYYNEQNKSDQIDELASNVTKIMSAVDQRVYIDKYDPNLWPNVLNYNTTRQTQEFLNRELIASTANCGDSSNGWQPTINDPSDSTEVAYKTNLQLVPCNVLGTAVTVNDTLTANLRITKSAISISTVDLYLFFEDQEDFREGFINLKKLAQKTRELDDKNVTGSHSYRFVDMTNPNPSLTSLTNQECLNLSTNCGFLAQYQADGEGVEYLDVTGANSMINSKVTFKERLDDIAPVQACFTYEYSGATNSWVRKGDLDCGIGIDPDKGHSFVEADVYSASAQRFNLDSLCDMDVSGVVQKVPCGMMTTNSGSSTVAVGVLDEIQATEGFVNLLNVTNIETGTLVVDGLLSVSGDSQLNTLTVKSESTFEDKVTFSGENNIIENNLTVNGLTELDTLNVSGLSNFQKDVNVLGTLEVIGTEGYVKANHLKLGTISSSDLHTSCDSGLEGAMKILKIEKYINSKRVLHTEPVICAKYTDISGSQKTAWKLANARVGQVLPFDGSCPEGFNHFEKSSGRFLIGQNETQLDGLSTIEKNALIASGDAFVDKNGVLLEYNIGETGGEAFHRLTEDEMPIHNHEVPDIKASCSGADCAGYAMAKVGARGDTVWSNANEIPTGPAGKDETHENRPPYYVVNYCIYEG